MEQSKIFIPIITTVIAAVLTYFYTVKAKEKESQLVLKKEQELRYFLPFKFICDELYHRLKHITVDLNKNSQRMINQLSVDLEGKEKSWYYIDWIDKDSAVPGGYFLASTVYMHAQLYFMMNKVLNKYPFLNVKVTESIKSLSTEDKWMQEAIDKIKKDQHSSKWVVYEKDFRFKGKCDLIKLIKSIRLSTVISGGILYAFHRPIGRYIEDPNDKENIMNYDDFVSQLQDKDERIKFDTLISFYQNIGRGVQKGDQFSYENKLRMLVLSLRVIMETELD